MSLRCRTKVFRYGIFHFHCDKKLMLLKTKAIEDNCYKIGDSVMVKPTEVEGALKADIIDLHGKFILSTYTYTCTYA